MLIVWGTHNFAKKQVGARRDFCNCCNHEVLTEEWQSFDMFHLYFIPLIPLGNHRRWLCTQCGKDPRRRYKTSPVFAKIAASFFALVFAFFGVLLLLSWAFDKESPRSIIIWGILSIVISAAIIWFTFFRPTKVTDVDLTNERRRQAVKPLAMDNCIYCGSALNTHPNPHCPHCKVWFYDHTELK